MTNCESIESFERRQAEDCNVIDASAECLASTPFIQFRIDCLTNPVAKMGDQVSTVVDIEFRYQHGDWCKRHEVKITTFKSPSRGRNENVV